MGFTSTKTTVCAVVKAWLFFITYSHILLFLAICDHNLHRNTYFLVFLHNEIVIRTCNFHLMLPLCVYA